MKRILFLIVIAQTGCSHTKAVGYDYGYPIDKMKLAVVKKLIEKTPAFLVLTQSVKAPRITIEQESDDWVQVNLWAHTNDIDHHWDELQVNVKTCEVLQFGYDRNGEIQWVDASKVKY